jgi:hypothetical protein
MADNAGLAWNDQEVSATVAAYFRMLTSEADGTPYVKAVEKRRVAEETGRTVGAVEFKFANVSAVLRDLELFYVPGYQPRSNYQHSLRLAVEKRLSDAPALGELLKEQRQRRRDGGWSKKDLPFLIADALGTGVDDPREWVSSGDTVEVKWHEAVGAACLVPYRPTKNRHMRELLEKLGLVWNDDRHTSSNTPSQGGGNLKREAYLDLYLAILDHLEPEDEAATDSWQVRAIRARRGQAQFRDALMLAYDRTCAVSGSTARVVLEAAHIEPFATGGKPVAANGLLLRADIHTLFDLGLLRVRPDLTVEVDKQLYGTEYESLEGKLVRAPVDLKATPSITAIEARYDKAVTLLGQLED